jgi:ABC-2 type transport system permease protein
VIAASNAVALPLLFLSDTFVTLPLLPEWFRPLVLLSPLTYFARGVRAITYGETTALPVAVGVAPSVAYLAALAVLSLVFFAVGAASVPRTD